MTYKIDAPISVILRYNHKTRRTIPVRVLWEGRDYTITKVGMRHHYKKGRTLYHVFSIASKETFFRVELNTESLEWRLTELSDDLSD